MDQIGTLELSWAQGYNGSQVRYVDKDVICYLCGSNVKIVAEDGAETVFNFPGEGVGAFAVHTMSRCFAVAEQCLNPKIYTFVYPTYRQMPLLQGGAQLEYSKLFFSSSDYLCSLSGIPDFELTLWNFVEGTKLCTYKLGATIPTSLGFNPGNWRQICVTMERSITILQIEQSDTHCIMQAQKVRLPPIDPDIETEEFTTRPSSRMTSYSVDVPKAAKAGLVGEMAEQLADIQDETVRVVPLSQAWTPIGDIYVGCKGGQLIKVDGEVFDAKVVYYPPPPADAPGSRMSSADSKRASYIDLQPVVDDVSSMLLEGSLDCIVLHKKGLYCAGQDGTIRCVDVKSADMKVTEVIPVGVPISSMAFSPHYRHLALGSTRGTLHLYEAGAPQSLCLLKDLHCGYFVGLSCLAGNENFVTCREDGELQVWMLDKGFLLSSVSVGEHVTSMACSPMLHVAAVGTVSGHIYYFDLNDVENPRIVQRHRVYQEPVTHLVYDNDGTYLLSSSTDGHVFVVDGRATGDFRPLAHTVANGEVQEISTYTEGTTVHVVVTHNTTGNKRAGADRVTSFEITEDVMKDLRRNCHSLKYDFKDDVINKMSCKLAVPAFGAAFTTGKTIYTLAQNNKRLNQFTMPAPEDLPVRDKENFVIEADSTFPGHQLPGGRCKLSPHHKWLCTYGTDGDVALRTIGQMDRTVSITPHDYRQGGVRLMAFAEDSQNIFTTGYDGVISCYGWNVGNEEETGSFSPAGIGKAKSAMEAARARKSKLLSSQKEEDEYIQSMADWSPDDQARSMSEVHISRHDKEKQQRDEALLKSEIYRTPTPTAHADATWFEVQDLEAFKEEDKQYADLKKNLRVSIRDMRKALQTMLRRNATLPEIEQLNRHEFDLDIEEQMRLQAEADLEVERVREEIEFENLAKIFLREMIKRECWDNMTVKGRAVQAFNSNLEVSNFPMRERPAVTTKMLETVVKRRKIEMLEAAVVKETVDSIHKPAPTTAEEDLAEGEEEEGKEQPSTTGSLGALYGGGSELFYSQFQLHTREQKVTQIVLLEDAIYRIKQVFNKDFDDLFVKKEQEINKIREKNKRIKKIISDLDLLEEVVEPTLGVAEKPESLLVVEDDEVTVDKFYTADQRAEMEKKTKVEEERRARERGDNIRDRALNDMMGGLLEIRKEDELKKDVPKPAFVAQKAEAEWTEDEQKLMKEYEKRVLQLQEEREKYRKQLETELRKLQAVIQEGMAGFDDILTQVFMKKIKVMMVIYQEELKIQRLRYSLLVEEELVIRDAELNRLAEHKKNLKQLAAQAVVEAKKNEDAYREQYDILVAEDKVMDKAFKREFNDVSAVQQDQLYRLFRRRPRGQKVTKPEGTLEAVGPNPFSDRPSTARQNAQSKVYTDNAMDELDKSANSPDGIESHIWQRLCMYRRQKVENENLLKVRAQTFAEMQAFLRRRASEDNQLKNEIEAIGETLNKLRDDRTRFSLNLEVQLLLKQGQVEVDAGSFIHDYKDSALLHRSVVEDLNSTIKQLGESKIASMMDSKDFRKGIIQLEWEHKKMLMLMEDFQNKMKDIQFMKVTREIQLFLNSPDYEGRKSEEVGKLELTILNQKRHHEKNVDEKKKILKELGKTIRQKDGDNEQLLKDLEDLNVSVHERRHIEEVNEDRRSDSGKEKRYQEIVQRRKLVDLAKAQAQEVAVLRAEVERLRMRTFPALVQVEH